MLVIEVNWTSKHNRAKLSLHTQAIYINDKSNLINIIKDSRLTLGIILKWKKNAQTHVFKVNLTTKITHHPWRI